MRWRKRGLIFQPDGHLAWMASHATMPTPEPRPDGRLRIYFSTRDHQNRSFPAYLEVDPANPSRVLDVCATPLLDLGPPGTFDDSGIMASSVLSVAGTTYLYYIGWNQAVSVPYRLAIGLALSQDDGATFHKLADGPVLDRAADDAYFCTTPHVIHDQGRWRMWYSSCTGWQTIDNHPEPFYRIRYAESEDGVRWQRSSAICVDYDAETEAIARPFVFRCSDGEGYGMYYSARRAAGYRTDPGQAYRLGYAESSDGISWTKREALAGLKRSAAGWDSEMIAYAALLQSPGLPTYLFYNGNGFGRSGFGYCEPLDACARTPADD